MSLGLKNVTQVVGSVISMLAVSPVMTAYLLLGVPVVISVGTWIGVFACACVCVWCVCVSVCVSVWAV